MEDSEDSFYKYFAEQSDREKLQKENKLLNNIIKFMAARNIVIRQKTEENKLLIAIMENVNTVPNLDTFTNDVIQDIFEKKGAEIGVTEKGQIKESSNK